MSMSFHNNTLKISCYVTYSCSQLILLILTKILVVSRTVFQLLIFFFTRTLVDLKLGGKNTKVKKILIINFLCKSLKIQNLRAAEMNLCDWRGSTRMKTGNTGNDPRFLGTRKSKRRTNNMIIRFLFAFSITLYFARSSWYMVLGSQ